LIHINVNDSFSGKPYDYWQVIEILIEWKDDAHAINVADRHGSIASYPILLPSLYSLVDSNLT